MLVNKVLLIFFFQPRSCTLRLGCWYKCPKRAVCQQVVYKRLEMIQLTAPYIPGFLAFREVDSITQLYKTMLKNAPIYKPDVRFIECIRWKPRKKKTTLMKEHSFYKITVAGKSSVLNYLNTIASYKTTPLFRSLSHNVQGGLYIKGFHCVLFVSWMLDLVTR